MTDYEIRRATASDASSLATCIDSAYAIYADRDIDLPPVSDGIADDIQSNLVWVAVRGRGIIGGLILIPREDHAILANVAVEPSSAGTGLGRALIDVAVCEARNLGLTSLRLTTQADIPENLRLYEHLGWRQIRRVANKVFMERDLVD
jgi:GNAT superfamily N-acetyltransferase